LLLNEQLTGRVIAAAIEVHRVLGPGLLESVYESCLCRELELAGLAYERQRALPVSYKDVRLDCGYHMDVVVAGEVVVELKSCERLLPVHSAQLLTYLRLGGFHVGLLINFDVPLLKDGIKRLVL